MYVVVGANGFLGAYILEAILKLTQETVLALDININECEKRSEIVWKKCDVSDIQSLEEVNQYLLDKEPPKIIYLAAYHQPDLVERNPRMAWKINIIALANFLNIIDNVKCFFYPSTDSVYGNGDADYHFREEDKLNPVNRYGKHKAAAECLVKTYGYNVVRFPFLIGPSLVPYKKHFYDEIVENLEKGKQVNMFVDSFRSSLDFRTVARLLVGTIEQYNDNMPKVLNISGDEDLSKYDIGLRIAANLRVSENLIVPISTDKSDGIFEAQRAKTTLMDNSLIKQVLKIERIKISL